MASPEPLPPPAGFDAAAPRYDDDEGDNPVLRHMRTQAWIHHARVFDGARMLVELGSGTGTEAARHAGERRQMVLVDPSPRLLAVAAAKVERMRPGALVATHVLPGRRVGELVAQHGAASFDGAYSSFGALNCEPTLEPVAEGLAALVRPGGAVVISLINRLCPPESAWYALHGEWREAGRRFGGPVWASAWPGGPKDVLTHYFGLTEVKRAFGRDFEVEWVEALPLLWPPPFLDFLVRRHPRLFAGAQAVDRQLRAVPGLRSLGDHVLVVMRRRR